MGYKIDKMIGTLDAEILDRARDVAVVFTPEQWLDRAY